MKKIALAMTAASLMFAGAASAADMAPRYTKAPPPPVAVFNWTGCYIGAYVGGATQSRSVRASDPQSTGGVFPAGTFYNTPAANAANAGLFNYDLDSSVIGGGTLGCNWQGAGSPWVIGVEGEAGYMRLSANVLDPYSVINGTSDTFASTRIGDWYGVVAGRAGYAWDRVLVYAKGGVGFTNVRSSFTDTCTVVPCGGGTLNATSSSDRAFWVVGGGIEYAFTPNWSIKGEYLFLGIDKTYTACGLGGGTAAGSTFCGNHNIEGIHTGKVGINYRFGGPVVAKY